jgi:hypothetical protein
MSQYVGMMIVFIIISVHPLPYPRLGLCSRDCFRPNHKPPKIQGRLSDLTVGRWQDAHAQISMRQKYHHAQTEFEDLQTSIGWDSCARNLNIQPKGTFPVIQFYDSRRTHRAQAGS